LSKISSETFLAKFTKPTHKNSKKVGVFICTNAKVHEMILDVVRLVHGYFIFVFLIINMLS
jgi:hypothetical protein